MTPIPNHPIDLIYQLWCIEQHILRQIDQLKQLDEASLYTSQNPFFTPENTKTLFYIVHQRMKLKYEFEKSLELFMQALLELKLLFEDINNEHQSTDTSNANPWFYNNLFKQIEKSHDILVSLGHPSTCGDCEGHGRASQYARIYEIAFMTLHFPFSPIGLILFAGVFIVHFVDSLITSIRFNRSLKQAENLIPSNTNILFRELAQHVGKTVCKSPFFAEAKAKLSQHAKAQQKAQRLTNNKHDCIIRTIWTSDYEIKPYSEQSPNYIAMESQPRF